MMVRVTVRGIYYIDESPFKDRSPRLCVCWSYLAHMTSEQIDLKVSGTVWFHMSHPGALKRLLAEEAQHGFEPFRVCCPLVSGPTSVPTQAAPALREIVLKIHSTTSAGLLSQINLNHFGICAIKQSFTDWFSLSLLLRLPTASVR